MSASLRAKDTIDLSVSSKEHEQAWKTQKESTTNKHSALSHGYYKAAVFDPTLNEYDCMMHTSPLEFGFATSQWLSITDIEILKKAGVLGIDDMRFIQLMHPEFQVNNKLVGKKSLPMPKFETR